MRPATTGQENRTPGVWRIWENPLIRRYARSRLRLRGALGWMLGVLMLSAFVFLTTYYATVHHGLLEPREAARIALAPLLVIQGVVLMLLGTGSAAGGIVEDKVSGTLDYQRLTPMKPLATLLGFLFGLPIREYVMFALTLPFSLFAVIYGEIPFSVIGPVYLVFLVSSILYHLTGMAAGLATRKWRFAARLTQGMVCLLYLVLPQFSHFGLYFFQYLTVRPVLAEKFMPILQESLPEDSRSGASWIGKGDVPFFEWQVSPFAFSLAIQGFLALVFLVICLRKWRDSESHLFAKWQAIGLYAAMATIALGNMWPILTGSSKVRVPFLGWMPGTMIPPEVGAAIPLLMALFLMLGFLVFSSMICPDRGEMLRGWRRALRTGRKKPAIGWDEHTSTWAALLLGVVGVGVVTVELVVLRRHGLIETDSSAGMLWLGIPLGLGVALISYQVALMLVEASRSVVLLLLGWVLPWMVGIFVSAALSWHQVAVYIAVISPATLPVYGASFLVEHLAGKGTDSFWLGNASDAFWVGLFFHGMMALVMALLVARRFRKIRERAHAHS